MHRDVVSVIASILFTLCTIESAAQTEIFADGFEGGNTASWSSTVTPDPPGSTCADAANISAQPFPFHLTGTFDDDPTVGPSCDITPTNTVWYRYTPSLTGEHEIVATNHTTTKAYSRLAIFEGASCLPYGAEVDCQTDASASVAATAILTAGTEYLIMFFTDGESYTMVDPEITINTPSEDGADLSLTDLLVSPSVVTDRQFSSASFQITNNGALPLSSETVLVEYYLSNDTTFGDGDDRQIGDTGLILSMAPGSSTTIILSSIGLANMTRFWDESLVPAGYYYVFAEVSMPSPPPSDPNPINNHDRTNSTIAYNLADLSLTGLAVSPSVVADRQFTSTAFQISNDGPMDLSSEWALVSYYLSTNTTFGDGDDRQIGDTGLILSIPSGSNTTIDLSSVGLANMTRFWDEELVDPGIYHVFASVSMPSLPSSDTNPSNDFDRADSPITYALADLSLTNMAVSPSTVTDRQFTSTSFQISNNGPVDLSSEWVLVRYYLSSNTTFGDRDDRQIGDTGLILSIASGSNTTIDLSSVGLANMARFWTKDLVGAGNYYVFAHLSLQASPPADPNSGNDFDRTTFTIFYNPP